MVNHILMYEPAMLLLKEYNVKVVEINDFQNVYEIWSQLNNVFLQHDIPHCTIEAL